MHDYWISNLILANILYAESTQQFYLERVIDRRGYFLRRHRRGSLLLQFSGGLPSETN